MKFRRENVGFEDLDNRVFPPFEEGALEPGTQAILKRIDKYAETPLKDPFGSGVVGGEPVTGMYKEQAESLYRQINSAQRSTQSDMDKTVLGQLKSALMADREQLVPEARAYMGDEAFNKYQQDFSDAVSYWKQMRQLQGEKTVQAIQNKQSGGQWDLNASQVKRNLLTSGDSVRSYQELSKMGGVDPAPALREALASTMDDFTINTPDGPRLDTKAFDKWQKGNRDMVDALPETVRQDLGRVGESANSYELQRTIRDEGKLKALLGGDPAETKSHKIIRDMLTTGQRGLNQGDFNRLQKATGVERERLSKLLGDSILYQLRTADVDMNPLTQRQQLDALTTNAGFLRSVYKGNPEIEAGIRGLQDLRRAQANLNRIKAGAELTGSNTANKLTESVMTKEKLESSTLGVLASRAGFMIGGGVGVPFIVGGIAVQGLPSRIIDASAKALSKIYLDPLVMAEALQSKNMQEVILNHAEALLPKLLEDSGSAATAAATRAAGSGRFQEGTVD
jgi:predicted DNA-binding protein